MSYVAKVVISFVLQKKRHLFLFINNARREQIFMARVVSMQLRSNSQ